MSAKSKVRFQDDTFGRMIQDNRLVIMGYHEVQFGEGRMAEWSRCWTLNHEIVGSSPAMHYIFCD